MFLKDLITGLTYILFDILNHVQLVGESQFVWTHSAINVNHMPPNM